MRCLLKRGNIPRHGQNGASPLICVFGGPRMITRWFRRAALTACAATLSTTVAHACSCVGPFPAEWLKEAVLVFRGRVVTSTPAKREMEKDGETLAYEATTLTFAVLERFKGPDALTTSVAFGECSVRKEPGSVCFDTCGSAPERGREYVVFAFQGLTEMPATDGCSAFAVQDSYDMRGEYSLKQLRKEQKRRPPNKQMQRTKHG
jgi:hypothetical protein